MTDAKSYRQILRSSVIIGGASILNILVGLVRTKVAAVLLGPAGVGLIGLFQNLMSMASTVAGLGFGNVGTRQIAEAAGRDDRHAVAAARRALFWGTLLLAVAGAALFWALRDVLAVMVVGDARSGVQIQWLAIGVAATVGASSQGALLNGLRRIGDIARVSIFSALLSTVLGIFLLLWLGQTGVVAFVLVAPLCTLLFGYIFALRMPKVSLPATPWLLIAAQWRMLAKLGAAFMLAGVVATLAQLLVRTLVQKHLGPNGLGNFQASWQISMTYLGFVLSAMGTDYYPRLTACIDDRVATNRMVNEQTEVALLLGGPVLLAMMGLAPWVIELLYSRQFQEAQGVLRWQVIGDLLKILSWPLGFILLAAGNGRAFLITEAIGFGLFVILTWCGLPALGIQATGMAFVGMYAAYLPMVYWLAHRKTGFRWSPRIWRQSGALLGLCVLVKFLAEWSLFAGGVFSLVAAFGLAIHAMVQFSRCGASENPVGRLCMKIFRKLPIYK
ncbi:membrane protein involved in the export of O-antigen and teichoic acid [Variovorax sp. CF313]|uniref:O-antigen translocase n=1 Tax=Variovorax sp. CF313 TaxID=1144315 RepID=UPI0002712813|nr:O-antigen translocase [Variovorax sp. CF313]EJL72833.1 membrane protein involved in the export of O-antigen and teichoic acid [Variovorax sp. CF313]